MKVSKSLIYVFTLLSLMLFGSVLLNTYQQQAKPTVIDPTAKKEITEIVLIRIAYNNTDYANDTVFIEKLERANEFVQQSSKGLMTLHLNKTIKYRTEYSESYYGNNGITYADEKIGELILEVPKQNNSAIILLHPGIAEELIAGNETGLIDEFFNGYIIFSEHTPWSVIVHELGHYWGLPDLYFASVGVGIYGMMGLGVWHGSNNDGSDPADFTAWSKIKLGWQQYVNITSVRKYEFNYSTVVIIDNVIIQYVSKGVEKPKILVVWDKHTTCEKAALLSSGDTQKIETNQNHVILVQAKENIIKVAYTTIDTLLKQLSINYDYFAYRIYQGVFIIFLIALSANINYYLKKR